MPKFKKLRADCEPLARRCEPLINEKRRGIPCLSLRPKKPKLCAFCDWAA
jgi:hypothetical protein